ncbi:hypothetical protein [Lichenihabitans psoromatis]|uniref:hypothetical protein n=1 Tax=Lichenihabitans psoromatis TaxID=2528642 RepID=UPI00103846DA|nr:hypothetical protein [Lichenihabitans psoromatis]
MTIAGPLPPFIGRGNCPTRLEEATDMPSNPLSDKARGVFAFAAYHQLTSSETVIDVILKDDAGHSADPAAIKELEDGGLVTVNGARAAFTSDGQAFFSRVLEAIRGAA